MKSVPAVLSNTCPTRFLLKSIFWCQCGSHSILDTLGYLEPERARCVGISYTTTTDGLIAVAKSFLIRVVVDSKVFPPEYTFTELIKSTLAKSGVALFVRDVISVSHERTFADLPGRDEPKLCRLKISQDGAKISKLRFRG